MRTPKIIIFLLLIAVLSTSVGCKKWIVRHKQKQDLREIDRKKREQDLEKQKKYQEAVKHQASIQNKKTRKSMKKQYRKAQRHNNNQKEFFLKRWFKGKKKLKSGSKGRNRE